MTSKLLTISLLFAALTACKSSTSQNNETNMNKQRVGNDTDEHGCLRSAGFTWSELKNECIRPFELAIKFTNKQDTSQGGYVFFTDDKSKAEFFGIESIPSLVLNKKEPTIYESKDGNYLLQENTNNRWSLFERKGRNNILLFELDK